MDKLQKRCVDLYKNKYNLTEEEVHNLFDKYNVKELLTMSFPELNEMDDEQLVTELELYFEVSELIFD